MMNVTPGELRQMLAHVDVKSPFGPRDYLLLVLAYNTGLRVSELASLTVGMVSFQGEPRATLCISQQIAKGSRARLIPFEFFSPESGPKVAFIQPGPGAFRVA